MIRIKLAFINLVIVAGSIAIAIAQWPTALHAVGGSQSITSAILLECLIAGIPIVLWGVAAHFALSWLLLKHGELDEYKARREIANLPVKPQVGRSTEHNHLD